MDLMTLAFLKQYVSGAEMVNIQALTPAEIDAAIAEVKDQKQAE
jgi:hypothetical protein